MTANDIPDYVPAFFEHLEREDWDALHDLFDDFATVVVLSTVEGTQTYPVEAYLYDLEERHDSYAEAESSIEEVFATEPWVVVGARKRAVRTEPYIGPNSPEGSVEEAASGLYLFRGDDAIAELRIMENVVKRLSDAGILRGGDDLTIQRQHYRVLTRILRHNIRNDLSKIRGFAELATEMPDRVDEFSETVRSVSDELIGTVEKAQAIERAIVRGDHAVTDVDVAETVRRAAATVVEETGRDPEVRVDVRDAPTLRSDDALLEPVVRELVENAVEHGSTGSQPAADDAVEHGSTSSRTRSDEAVVHADSTLPRVDVVVGRTDDGRIRLTVADDGPGIADDELAPFEETSETDLTHGSGIGLWIVKWGVERLDGDVEFDTANGTEVTIRLPPEPHASGPGGG